MSARKWVSPNTDGVALALHTSIADDDIVTACGALAGGKPECDVVVAGLVIEKRLLADGRVAPTREGRIGRQGTNRYVGVASGVVNERPAAEGSVAEADGVVKKRTVTDGRV